MAGITLVIAEARLTEYLAAEQAVLLGKQYSFSSENGGYTVSKADLVQIRDGIEFWDKRVKQLTNNGSIKVRSATPVIEI